MAESNSTLQAQIEALDAAMATGELIVRYGDRSVTYRSVDELMKARMTLTRQVRGGPRFKTARFNEHY